MSSLLTDSPAIPDKRPRKMASMEAIREHWDMPYGKCFRCGQNAQVVRGHVIAHMYGGEGTVDNLVPLCARCNKACPPWAPQDHVIAWAWMRMDAEAYVRWFFAEIHDEFVKLPGYSPELEEECIVWQAKQRQTAWEEEVIY